MDNEMSKDEARKYLEDYIANKCLDCDKIYLPIKDSIVLHCSNNNTINEYTFKHLLCIAYGLHE
jgi:hypothetical protein